MTADLVVSGEVLDQAQFTPAELLLEIAVYLYAKERLSIGQARRLAGLDLIAFQRELSRRNIYIHYDIKDLHTDLRNLGLPIQ